MTFFGKKREKRVLAKIDTGADKSVIDVLIAQEIGVIYTSETYTTHYPSGRKRVRPLCRVWIGMRDFTSVLDVVVDNRSNMRYAALIGNDILKQSDVLIDPSGQ